jgi:hypothetical protein
MDSFLGQIDALDDEFDKERKEVVEPLRSIAGAKTHSYDLDYRFQIDFICQILYLIFYMPYFNLYSRT